MDTKCKMCGKCCQKLYTSHDINYYKKLLSETKDVEFATELKTIIDMLIPILSSPSKSRYLYRCKHISEDNKCLIYKKRPTMCREFPFYGRTTITKLLMKNCGYRTKDYNVHLFGVLVK